MRVLCYSETRFQDSIASLLQNAALLEKDIDVIKVSKFKQEYAVDCDLWVVFQDQSLTATKTIQQARRHNIPTLLVQDGFLSFRMAVIPSWKKCVLWPVFKRLRLARPFTLRTRIILQLYRWVYHLHFFGHTRPDYTIVQNNVMQRRLTMQFDIPASKIKVAGSPTALLPTNSVDSYKFTKNNRVLFLDQPMLKYSRLTKELWKSEYLGLLEKLSQNLLNLDVKIHPSQTSEARHQIATILPDAQLIGQDRLLDDQTLKHYDVIVTINSTGFLQALSANRAVIVYHMSGGVDDLPYFNHPLMAHASRKTDVSREILAFLEKGQFPTHLTGNVPLKEHFFETDESWAQIVIRAMLETESPAKAH